MDFTKAEKIDPEDINRSGKDRREFLRYLALSPCIAAAGGLHSFLKEGGIDVPPAQTGLIKSPAEALNVFDFEEVAHQNVQPGHWAYMVSGVDADADRQLGADYFSQ